MKEYIKKFESAVAADNYSIVDIPFTTSVAPSSDYPSINYIQNLVCDQPGKKLVNVSGIVEIQSAGPEMVDLGLSVKWAKCNLGAETETDYGDYYAWGEVETKSNYSWATYKHTNGTYSKTNKKVFIKYCPTAKEATYWGGTGSADNKLVLDLGDDGDDIVNKLYGGNYRMPTEAEFNELLDTNKVTNILTTKNGVNGREFTSLINGNTLFIPAAGYYYNSTLDGVGSRGLYWSSSLNLNNPYHALSLYFYSNNIGMYSDYRYLGRPIRPVC